jgi:3-oxoacyl-[acyl-carrier protein] reductase
MGSKEMSKKLAGKVAVVPGASKGIGASIAQALAEEGASVVVDYSSSKPDAERVVAEIGAHGGTAIAVQADVSISSSTMRALSGVGGFEVHDRGNTPAVRRPEIGET